MNKNVVPIHKGYPSNNFQDQNSPIEEEEQKKTNQDSFQINKEYNQKAQ